MAVIVLEVLDLEPDFLEHFAMDSLFNGLSRFHKTRQRAVEVAASVSIFGKKNFFAPVD